MAEEEGDSRVSQPGPDPQRSPSFVEVICKSSGKTRRFAAGTEAGFAWSLINRKLDVGAPVALHIEAVKEGEEPISFGPNSVLVDYGDGWRLQTVTEIGGPRKGKQVQAYTIHDSPVMGSSGLHPLKRVSQPNCISFLYIGKILLAFALIFAFGAIFTLVLENLPRLILFINSTM